MGRYVACPRCGTQVPWSGESRYRPFCSERCKMADLGAWATEEYRVPAADAKNSTDEPDPDEPSPGR